MKKPDLTDKQKLGLDLGRNIAIRAGAGSGKTTVLTRRYLEILETHRDPANLDHIVAITFTEKAAAELKNRILKLMLERLQKASLEGTQEECAYWAKIRDNFHRVHISTIHGFCASLLREFPVEADIDPQFTVLDETQARFLVKDIIHDHVQELSLDYDQRLKDISTFVPREDLLTCLEFLYQRRYPARQWGNSLSKDTDENVRECIQELGESYIKYRIRETVSDPELVQFARLVDENVKLEVDEEDKLFSKLLGISEYCEKIIKGDANNMTIEDFQKFVNKLHEIDGRTGSGKFWKPHETVMKETKTAIGGIKDFFSKKDRRNFAEKVFDELDEISIGVTRNICAIYNDVTDRIDRTKNIRNVLDYEDLLMKTLDLLGSGDNTGVTGHLRRRYRWIMIDEFQDTNMLQWEIFRHLVAVGESLENEKLFIVGDDKQSIYAFRGADVSVFRKVQGEITGSNRFHGSESRPARKMKLVRDSGQKHFSGTGILELDENFRSMEQLVETGNSIFRNILGKKPGEEYRDFESQPKDLRCKSLYPEMCGTVELLVVNAKSSSNHQEENEESEDSYTGTAAEAEIVAARIREILDSGMAVYEDDKETETKVPRPVKPSDIAILFRRKRNWKTFESMLRVYGIDYIVVGGIGYYQQQEVIDLMNLFKYLTDPRQDIGLVGVLRSPLFSLSDDTIFRISQTRGNGYRGKLLNFAKENTGGLNNLSFEMHAVKEAFERLETWIKLVYRISPSEMLNRILDETGAWAAYTTGMKGRQSIANLEKLIEHARRFDSYGVNGIDSFVEYLETSSSEDVGEGEAQLELSEEEGVRLMTIHAAKGLEFNIVFLPELSRNLITRAPGREFYLERINGKYQFGLKLFDPYETMKKKHTMLSQTLKYMSGLQTIAEEKRIFYVGWTRAKQHLVLAAQEKENEKSDSIYMYLRQHVPGLQNNENGDQKVSNNSCGITVKHRKDIHAGQSGTEFVYRFQDVESRFRETLNTGNGTDSVISAGNASRDFMPVAVPQPVIQLSPTSYIQYLQCPAGYYFRVILGIKDTDFTGRRENTQPETEGIPAVTLGTVTHELCERLQPGRIPTMDDAHFCAGQHISGSEQVDQLARDAFTHMMRLAESDFGKKMLAHSRHLTELPFVLRYDNALINGVIDRLYTDGETENWQILDYKTNRINESEVEFTVQKSGYDIQMLFYALAVYRILNRNIKEVNTQLFFTSPGVLWEKRFHVPDIIEFEEKLESVILEISKGVFVARPENDNRCTTCVYKEHSFCAANGNTYRADYGYRYTVLK